jgi:protoheme ferro-lyase
VSQNVNILEVMVSTRFSKINEVLILNVRKALVIGSLITITLLLTQVNFIQGYNYLKDGTNDILRYEDGTLKSIYNSQSEIDIVSFDLVALKLRLDFQTTPNLVDKLHLYTVTIIWSSANNYQNLTEIKVGGTNGQNFFDEINHTIVDASGVALPSQPVPLYNSTVVEDTELVWVCEVFNNDEDVLFNPENINATAEYFTVENEQNIVYKDAIFEHQVIIPGFQWNFNTLLSIFGTLLVCGFAGYTLGSITVYFLTTNIRSKQTNTIFMAVFVVGLAVLVNFWFWLTPLQLIWNIGIFLLAIVFGYMWATRGIMRLKFDSPLPENLPIDTEDKLGAVIILAKGESDDYNPLPLIRRFYKNVELDVKQKSKFLQPFEFYKVKRKYRKIIKEQQALSIDDIKLNAASNPYRKIIGDLVNKLEESFLNFDMYQVAFVNDWPTMNQALLTVISRGSNKITVLNLFTSECYEYDLAIKEMGKIDYSQIGVTISQTDFLATNDDIQDLVANKIKEAVPTGQDLKDIGVILVAEGQIEDWDPIYPLTEQETLFRDSIKKKLSKLGFNNDKIELAWIENRSPSIEESFLALVNKGCRTIVHVAATTPIECVNSLYDIPVTVNKLAKDHEVNTLAVNAWNVDEKIIALYLGLITDAKELPLAELGKDADIILQSTQIGAKLSESEETEKSEEESKAQKDE